MPIRPKARLAVMETADERRRAAVTPDNWGLSRTRDGKVHCERMRGGTERIRTVCQAHSFANSRLLTSCILIPSHFAGSPPRRYVAKL